LKIAINSRMFLEKGTGVPNYIAYLYRACLKLDRDNQYVFFQPNLTRTIGLTEVAPTRRGMVGAAWFDCLRVQKLIRRFRPDIYHGPSHILPLWRVPGVKYVVTIHDLAFRAIPSHWSWIMRAYYGWQIPRSLKMADVIVADSQNTKKDIIHFYGVSPKRIEVVHLGAGEQFLKAAGTPRERLVADKYFFSITTHPARKNILGALKAFALFANQSKLKYVIAGLMGEAQRHELCAYADKLGIRDQIVLFGYADDDQLISLYQNAEFLIYPSFYEGFGLPLVEAMACGCPVIAANASSLPEVMPDSEWLVDPHHAADMAGQMQRMLALSASERAALIVKNQHHVQNFTWEKAARRMIEIFAQL
jgi:glycosyltransferase involved in cell wall biosynthesis